MDVPVGRKAEPSAAASSPLEPMSSFRYTLRRWCSMVFGLRNSAAAASRLVSALSNPECDLQLLRVSARRWSPGPPPGGLARRGKFVRAAIPTMDRRRACRRCRCAARNCSRAWTRVRGSSRVGAISELRAGGLENVRRLLMQGQCGARSRTVGRVCWCTSARQRAARASALAGPWPPAACEYSSAASAASWVRPSRRYS